MKVFFSVGEPSGDLHASNLIRTLKARANNISITGFGGPRMAEAGADLIYPLTDLAVMGIGAAIRHLPTFYKLVDLAGRAFRSNRPDAVVLVDYPDFNFAVGRRAKSLGIPVIYFVPPQIWAWRRGRVREMRRWCEAVLSTLPFEDRWLRKQGVNSHYIGHPYFDELTQQTLDAEFLAAQRNRDGMIIGLLPGSRDREVADNFEMMKRAAEILKHQIPDTRFLVGAYRDRQAAKIRDTLAGSSLDIEVYVGKTPEVIELSHCCVAVSGSVSLELMYRTKPAVMIYKMNRLSLWLARRLIKLPSFTLVNLLAGRRIMPEVATATDASEQIAAIIHNWIRDEESWQRSRKELLELKSTVGRSGACGRAAEVLLQTLSMTA